MTSPFLHFIPSLYANIWLSFLILYFLVEGILFIFSKVPNQWKYRFRALPYLNILISFYYLWRIDRIILKGVDIAALEKGTRYFSVFASIRNGLPGGGMGFETQPGERFTFTLFDWFFKAPNKALILLGAALLLFSVLRLLNFLKAFKSEHQVKKWKTTPYNANKLSKELLTLLEQKKVEIYESDKAQVPFLYGFFRPMIILPSSIHKKLTHQEIESVIYHEVAHRNYFNQLLFFMMQIISILFFLPTWHVQLTLEKSCDEVALKSRVKKIDLISAMNKLAQKQKNNQRFNSVYFSSASQLVHRIRHISHFKKMISQKWLLALVFLTWIYVCLFVCRTHILVF